MKKAIFTTAFFAVTLVSFIFGLIMALSSYRYYNSDAYMAAKGKNVAYAALPTNQNIFSTTVTEKDGREEKVRQFLAQYHSPLEPYAGDIVAAADEYGLDYRLIPAIAMQESGLCKTIPYGSYNCWGFGIYGKTVKRFSDYKDGIYTVTHALATKYKDRGLVTPNEIMTMYTPSSNGSWAFSVNHFMAQLQ